MLGYYHQEGHEYRHHTVTQEKADVMLFENLGNRCCRAVKSRRHTIVIQDERRRPPHRDEGRAVIRSGRELLLPRVRVLCLWDYCAVKSSARVHLLAVEPYLIGGSQGQACFLKKLAGGVRVGSELNHLSVSTERDRVGTDDLHPLSWLQRTVQLGCDDVLGMELQAGLLQGVTDRRGVGPDQVPLPAHLDKVARACPQQSKSEQQQPTDHQPQSQQALGPAR